jgi:hypothetical protein
MDSADLKKWLDETTADVRRVRDDGWIEALDERLEAVERALIEVAFELRRKTGRSVA